jgi:lipoprotein-releasing system ATP-binding protein
LFNHYQPVCNALSVLEGIEGKTGRGIGMSSALFEAVGICKTYRTGLKDLNVLQDINIAIKSGEMAAITGASGSGKTTLLQILGTLAVPTSGELRFKSENLHAKSEKELAEFRNVSLGFIFQFHHLLPEFSALENVMMPALIAGMTKQQAQAPAQELLAAVELDQRTALARALIMKPELLLADEPTGNLDSRAGRLVFDLLQHLCRERSLAVLMVTHNMELAGKMDRCLTLKDCCLI